MCRITANHLGRIGGLVDSLISDEEVEVIHAFHHPSLGLVSHLRRLFDGDAWATAEDDWI